MKILVCSNDGDHEYYEVPNDKTLHITALHILRTRYEYEWYDEDDDVKVDVEQLLLEDNGAEAWKFLRQRYADGYESEGLWIDEAINLGSSSYAQIGL